MSREIFCKKLQKNALALEHAPYPGAIGERILAEISQPAWEMWVNHQTILINEYRLSMIDPEARKFLLEEMEKFLFGDGSDKPDAFTPPEE